MKNTFTTFDINTAVSWISSNTKKTGIVVAVIPAGTHPATMGFTSVGKNAGVRTEVSYVIRGQIKNSSPTLYWPLTSLLSRLEGLTPEEIAWCHNNAIKIRTLMQKY
jgi:hypothetical protein